MSDILQQRLKPSPDAFASSVGDETVLLQVVNGAYYGLDPIGTVIWNGISQGRTALELCREIADEHDVPIETVENDVRAFLHDLKDSEIVLAS